MTSAQSALREAILSLPVIDVHTHLGSGGFRQAQSLAHLASYHWLHTELARAGCPATQALALEDPDAYMEQAAPFFAAIVNTANHHCFVRMLHDLYGYDEPCVTPGTWRSLDAAVRANRQDPAWLGKVLDRGHIRKLPVTLSDGLPDDSGRYWPYAYGECLCMPYVRYTDARPISALSTMPGSAAELRAAVAARVEDLHATHGVRTLHLWLRDTWSFSPPDDRLADIQIRRALAGETLDWDQRGPIMNTGLEALAQAAGRLGMTLQVFHGMLYYRDPQTRSGLATYWNPDFVRRLPLLLERCPDTRVDLFLATRLASQEAASVARLWPNLAVSGGWWHGFSTATLRAFLRDRLDLLPHTAWNAFFSDGYVVEWVYAKLILTRHALALTLGDMVDEGLISHGQAVDMARALLYANALKIYGVADTAPGAP